MITEIDQKLDSFFNRLSPRFRDYAIWEEVFDIAKSYEKTNPELFNYEIKRLRDLKNVTDHAYEQGLKAGRKEA